jgi:hypothetical protein
VKYKRQMLSAEISLMKANFPTHHPLYCICWCTVPSGEASYRGVGGGVLLLEMLPLGLNLFSHKSKFCSRPGDVFIFEVQAFNCTVPRAQMEFHIYLDVYMLENMPPHP